MPHSVFPIPPGEEIAISFASAMCESLMLRAKAAQREGNSKAFIQGLRICFRLHEAFQARPELYNQLAAFAIADHILFALEPQTPWSREESELLARVLKRMDWLPDIALSLQYEQASALDMSIYKDGRLPSVPKGNWLPQGWMGLAYTWWLDLQQFRIDSARLWPAKSKLPDPRVDGPRIWQGFAAVAISSDDDIDGARNAALEVRMRVALARLEHAFGWFRREHGHDIENPEDLLPYLDGAWPINPYTGKPHVIESHEDRWCIRWNLRGLPPGPKDIWSFPSRSTLTP